MYTVVAEAKGHALPLAFSFITTHGTVATGAKDQALQDVLQWLKPQMPNVKFTLSDKDILEIKAFATVFNTAKHQLCYWHAIRYLEQRLSENSPPAAYDGRWAHKVFEFIDPTWAPGVTQGKFEEGTVDPIHKNKSEVCNCKILE